MKFWPFKKDKKDKHSTALDQLIGLFNANVGQMHNIQSQHLSLLNKMNKFEWDQQVIVRETEKLQQRSNDFKYMLEEMQKIVNETKATQTGLNNLMNYDRKTFVEHQKDCPAKTWDKPVKMPRKKKQ